MKTKPSFRPEVEALEALLLPSTVTAPPLLAAVPAHVHHHHAHPRLDLHGMVSGAWSSQITNPDVGATQHFEGLGKVGPLGPVQVHGHLTFPGFMLDGEVKGTFVLSNAEGSVTLRLIGKAPPIAWQVTADVRTEYLHFTIVDGTGDYHDARGSGRAVLREYPAETPVTPPGHIHPDLVIAPSFTLRFEEVVVHHA